MSLTSFRKYYIFRSGTVPIKPIIKPSIIVWHDCSFNRNHFHLLLTSLSTSLTKLIVLSDQRLVAPRYSFKAKFLTDLIDKHRTGRNQLVNTLSKREFVSLPFTNNDKALIVFVLILLSKAKFRPSLIFFTSDW